MWQGRGEALWLQNVWGLRWEVESLGDTAAGAWAAQKSHCQFCHPPWSKPFEPVQIQEGTRPHLSRGEVSKNSMAIGKNGQVPKSSLRRGMFKEPQGGAWTKPALSEVGLARPLKAL